MESRGWFVIWFEKPCDSLSRLSNFTLSHIKQAMKEIRQAGVSRGEASVAHSPHNNQISDDSLLFLTVSTSKGWGEGTRYDGVSPG